MSEARRAAGGEMIYRDFASMYPPLGVTIVGAAYRLFGATFAVTNAVIDGLSVVAILVTWRLALRFLEPRVALGSAVVLACLGATNGGNFGLFSLMLYTPAMLCGLIGLGVTLIGALDLVVDEQLLSAKALIVFGLTVASLSKLEHAVAAAVVLSLLAISKFPRHSGSTGSIGRWTFRYFSLGVTAIAPSIVAYGFLARTVSTANLFAGISGYGIAGKYCPLWPTGLGALGALAALGQAAALLAALSIVCTRSWRNTRRKLVICVLVIALGSCLWAVHLPYALENFRIAQPNLHGARLGLAYCFSMSGLFLPLMWSAIVFTLVLGVHAIKHGFSNTTASLSMVSTATTVLASRGMFGHMFGNVTIVHQSAYPLLVPLSAYLILYATKLVGTPSPPTKTAYRFSLPTKDAAPSRQGWILLTITAAVLVIPRSVRTITSASQPRLDTLAGTVLIADFASREAYTYVLSHTRPSDSILEAPLGGGLSFATHRPPATYSMQFNGLLTPLRLMHRDAELVKARPPRVAIGFDIPTLGANYGVCARCACMFPHLVWKSDRLACDPAQGFEALDFVRAHYKKATHFGEFAAFVPDESISR